LEEAKAKGKRPTRGSRRALDRYRSGTWTPEIDFTIRVVLAARRWRALVDERLRGIDQSSARMEALGTILNSPKLSAQVDVARRLRIEGPTLTRMLDSLERDGLVERMPDPNDRRTKLLQITPQGEEVLEKIFEITDVLRARLLAGVSSEMIALLNGFLGEMIERLDEGLPGKDGEP
jgi:MarR family transcriptional regulator for hemolysin